MQEEEEDHRNHDDAADTQNDAKRDGTGNRKANPCVEETKLQSSPWLNELPDQEYQVVVVVDVSVCLSLWTRELQQHNNTQCVVCESWNLRSFFPNCCLQFVREFERETNSSREGKFCIVSEFVCDAAVAAVQQFFSPSLMILVS
jgi:hypothetical protein